VIIRPAKVTDLPAIVEIENHEIVHGSAHFATTPVTLGQAQVAFKKAAGRYPWFVAVDEVVIGFARCSGWKARESYQWTAEVGIYVRPERHGKGVGHALYESLFPAMRSCGLRTILAGIALPNPASIKLHESFGMKHVGTLPCAGFKHERWVDVGYWAVHWSEAV
jgi:phosphinothricin acetyltransferase